MSKKLVLVVVDSLKTEMLELAASSGEAPTLARLLERGVLIPDCVSSFPSVTPVACSEIATGTTADRHWISGMNWYSRAERRYVEYGSSFEATRAFGLFRALYDVVYNMNLAHLSHEVSTVFESLGDAGLRTACTPFLIYRGRRRHELSLEGMMRRVALAADFRHAVWGPDELFYGELYASRRVPCKPTLARPGTRDEYSACVSEELIRDDACDFLLFSLPDNDHYTHRHGPDAMVESISRADANLTRIVNAGGGLDAFLAENAVVAMADHSQTAVERELPIIEALSADWRVQQPGDESPQHAELAVSPTARAAGVYVLGEGSLHARAHRQLRERLEAMEGVDLVAWLAEADGTPVERAGGGTGGKDVEAVVRSERGELRFRAGPGIDDPRGDAWDIEGDLAVVGGEVRDGVLESPAYPLALGRLWAALNAPQAGDLLVSAAQGYECVDWGGMSHVGGGSHGSLLAGDSLGPLLFVGCGPERPADEHRQWALRDVNDVVLSHFGVSAATPSEAAA